MLKAISGPFPKVRFCPTGGISEANFKEYLSLSNVVCVGGSWLSPADDIHDQKWEEITRLAKSCFN